MREAPIRPMLEITENILANHCKKIASLAPPVLRSTFQHVIYKAFPLLLCDRT